MVAFRGVRGCGPKNLHDVMFHAIVQRTLAEVMGSAQPADYAVPHMRSLSGDGIKVGAAPFEKKSEDVTWMSVKVVPAYATLAFRVQAEAVVQHVPPSASAVPGGVALAQVMQQYVQSTKETGQMSQERYVVIRLGSTCQEKWHCQACLTFRLRMCGYS